MRLDHNGEEVDGPCCPDTTKRVCFTCRRHVAVRLQTLATNLGVASALCAAFKMGDDYGQWLDDPYQSANREPWRPGCRMGMTR